MTTMQEQLDLATARVAVLRNVLACISLDEYESSSSASEKVRAGATRARAALAATDEAARALLAKAQEADALRADAVLLHGAVHGVDVPHILDWMSGGGSRIMREAGERLRDVRAERDAARAEAEEQRKSAVNAYEEATAARAEAEQLRREKQTILTGLGADGADDETAARIHALTNEAAQAKAEAAALRQAIAEAEKRMAARWGSVDSGILYAEAWGWIQPAVQSDGPGRALLEEVERLRRELEEQHEARGITARRCESLQQQFGEVDKQINAMRERAEKAENALCLLREMASKVDTPLEHEMFGNRFTGAPPASKWPAIAENLASAILHATGDLP